MKIPNQHCSTIPRQKAAFSTEQSLHPPTPQTTALHQAQQIKPTLLKPPSFIPSHHHLLSTLSSYSYAHSHPPPFPLFSPVTHLTTEHPSSSQRPPPFTKTLPPILAPHSTPKKAQRDKKHAQRIIPPLLSHRHIFTLLHLYRTKPNKISTPPLRTAL